MMIWHYLYTFQEYSFEDMKNKYLIVMVLKNASSFGRYNLTSLLEIVLFLHYKIQLWHLFCLQ
jgi:hypothetical protein